jgi:glycosyltransferase involved in cell wall biosynthesis
LKVYLQGSLGLYGVETFVSYLYFYLRRMGFDVSITVPFGRILVRAGGSETIDAKSRKNLHWLRSVDRDTDLIHVSYALVSLPLLLLQHSSRFVYTIHGVPQPELESGPLFKVGYVFERASLKRVARRASKVVAISNFVRDLLKTDYDVEAHVIRNGVDTKMFHPLETFSRGALRSQMHLPLDKHIVLFVGRLHASKDPLTLVRCMPRVISKRPDAYFVLIGDGPMRHFVAAEIVRLKLEKFCRLIPRLEHSSLPAWYQLSDLFVSTSPKEMLGIAVLEAMSSGLPVIATDFGGPREVLGSSGILFRSGDPNDLAEKISGLIVDQRTGLELGQKARETVIRDFRWEEVARKYADLYNEADRKS